VIDCHLYPYSAPASNSRLKGERISRWGQAAQIPGCKKRRVGDRCYRPVKLPRETALLGILCLQLHRMVKIPNRLQMCQTSVSKKRRINRALHQNDEQLQRQTVGDAHLPAACGYCTTTACLNFETQLACTADHRALVAFQAMTERITSTWLILR